MHVVHLIFPRIPTLIPNAGCQRGVVEEGILEGESFRLTQIFPSICAGAGRISITVQWTDLLLCKRKSTVQFHFSGDRPNEEAISAKCCPVEFVMNAIGTTG